MGMCNVERDERDPRPLPGTYGTAKQQSPYQFNSEELRVLKECNRESFFQRCVPASALLGGGLYYGVKTGFLRGHSRYGATPKVVIGVIVGYFIGKFSYQRKCAEKLMMLPNSPIGEMLRQRRKGGFQESLDTPFGPGMSLAPFSSISPSDTYTDLPPRSSLDIDTTRPEVEGLDDTHRPSIDNPIYEEELPPVQQHPTTYEELRKRNREDYQQRRAGNYKELPPELSHPQTPISPRSDSGGARVQTNKYGDPWG